MQDDEILVARNEISFLIQETISTYHRARDDGELGELQDQNWEMRCDEENNSILVEDEIIDYMSVFLAGYAVSIVNSNDRDWVRIYKEITERDFLKTEGLCEWMIEGVNVYPKISNHIICIAHLRYKVLEFIENYLLEG